MSSPARASTTGAAAILVWDTSPPDSYAIRFPDGSTERRGPGPPAFTLIMRDRRHYERLLESDAYTAARWFIQGEFGVEGDLVAAVRFHEGGRRRGWRDLIHSAAATIWPARIETLFQSRRRAAGNIRFHYDHSSSFFRCFLDSRMVYSCAYFHHPGDSLDTAQLAKLDLICRKLDLHPGDRFLDIGCGWGALLIHAAGQYGAWASGCTLSRSQADSARLTAASLLPGAGIRVLELDFRDLAGRFSKITSVGMFEHVGRRRLHGYFRKVNELLEPDGLFLNHGIVRPQPVGNDPQTLFVQRRVFPGGELPHLSDVIRTAELEGFEALDVEDLRPHYALTCRAWVRRLEANAAACLAQVGSETYRTWLLYLAGSAANFASGLTSVCQVLFAKRDSPHRRLTRDYMFA